jgi:membrane protein
MIECRPILVADYNGKYSGALILFKGWLKDLKIKRPWFGKFCGVCAWLKGFLVFGYQHFESSKCLTSAAALTYVSLFAIVPLITVTYVAFSFFPSYESVGLQVEEFLFSHFLPNTSVDLINYLKTFANQAKNLTWFGVVFLIFSVQMMLRNIEDNLNSIWGVKRRPRGFIKLIVYWLILLLGATLAMSTYVFSLHLFGGISESKAIKTLLGVAPFLLTWLAFTVLFVALPNSRVTLWHGIVGAGITTLFFHGLKAVFAWGVSFSSYSLVYGAFAAIPLFLLWINLTWAIILGGAVLVFSIENYQSDKKNNGSGKEA